MTRLSRGMLITVVGLLALIGMWWLQAEGFTKHILAQVFMGHEPPGACYVAGKEPACQENVTRLTCQGNQEKDFFLDPSGNEQFRVYAFRPGSKCIPGAKFIIGHGENIVVKREATIGYTISPTAYPNCLEDLNQLIQREFPGQRITIEGPYIRHYKGWTQQEAAQKLGKIVPSPVPDLIYQPLQVLYRATCGQLVAPAGAQELALLQQQPAAPPPPVIPRLPILLDPATLKSVNAMPFDEAKAYLERHLRDHPESVSREMVDNYIKERGLRERAKMKIPVPKVKAMPPRFVPKIFFPRRLISTFCQGQVTDCTYPDSFKGRFCERLAPVTCEI